MTTEQDHNPADRIINQRKGKLYGTDREVLVTEYGDGSQTVTWRPDPYSTWRPWTEMSEA